MIIVILNNEKRHEFPNAVEAKPSIPGFMGIYERNPSAAANNPLKLVAQIKTKLINSILYRDF